MSWRVTGLLLALGCSMLGMLSACAADTGSDQTAAAGETQQAIGKGPCGKALPRHGFARWHSWQVHRPGWPRAHRPVQGGGGPGWSTPRICHSAEPAVDVVCGNGIVGPRETCDDGNTVAGDGCEPDCGTEPGWVCNTPDAPCTRPVCGDAVMDYYRSADGATWVTEGCDDGNTEPGDGCDGLCQPEPDWVCPLPGTCYRAICGNGVVDQFAAGGGETCDDGNATSGDGCSATCTIESPWLCPEPGKPCHPLVCGDGLQDLYESPEGWDTFEECDDGNVTPGDGCDADCQQEPGWVCFEPNEPCQVPRCGNGIREGFELADETSVIEDCDDGNTGSGDGCSATCTYEPNWTCLNGNGPCLPVVCGDGCIDQYPTEDGSWQQEPCDDGNRRSGDGCSATCQKE